GVCLSWSGWVYYFMVSRAACYLGDHSTPQSAREPLCSQVGSCLYVRINDCRTGHCRNSHDRYGTWFYLLGFVAYLRKNWGRNRMDERVRQYLSWQSRVVIVCINYRPYLFCL